jgi:hypothetical protein
MYLLDTILAISLDNKIIFKKLSIRDISISQIISLIEYNSGTTQELPFAINMKLSEKKNTTTTFQQYQYYC